MKAFVFIKTFFLLILFSGLESYSQDIEREGDILQKLKASDGLSGFRVELDPMIEDNYYKHLLYNKKNDQTMGYRIRIFSGSGNDAFQRANLTRGRFLTKFENINAYISYDAPDYKVYAGDCRTRSEALKLFKKINKEFPYAFIVSQPINVKTDN